MYDGKHLLFSNLIIIALYKKLLFYLKIFTKSILNISSRSVFKLMLKYDVGDYPPIKVKSSE